MRRHSTEFAVSTGAGIERALRAQFEPLEEALEAMGVAVWALVSRRLAVLLI